MAKVSVHNPELLLVFKMKFLAQLVLWTKPGSSVESKRATLARKKKLSKTESVSIYVLIPTLFLFRNEVLGSKKSRGNIMMKTYQTMAAI